MLQEAEEAEIKRKEEEGEEIFDYYKQKDREEEERKEQQAHTCYGIMMKDVAQTKLIKADDIAHQMVSNPVEVATYLMERNKEWATS